MSENLTVLVVGAHPDDEVFGCGGTIARHAAAGDDIHILFLSEGVSSREILDYDTALTARRKAARKAAEILGANPPIFCDHIDNQLDSIPLLELIMSVFEVVKRVRPHIVYTHHGNDLNVDHRLTQEAVLTVCRPLPGSSIRAIYAFETVSSTEWATPAEGVMFRPTRFVEISNFLDIRKRALECYADEMRRFPHARSYESIIALALLRGSHVGLPAAEAFEVVREVVADVGDSDKKAEAVREALRQTLS